MLRRLLLPVLLASAATADATLQASSLFSDGAVLQTTDDGGPGAKVSGTSAPNEKISLKTSLKADDGGRLPPDVIHTTADGSGQWILALNATSGGPYKMTIADSKGHKVVANDVMIGDVYICSGQR